MTSGRAAVDRTSQDRTSQDLRVFISNRESRCDDCGDDLGRHAMIFLAGDRGALCLTCADLDHLTFLPPRDAALTRRARKYSTLGRRRAEMEPRGVEHWDARDRVREDVDRVLSGWRKD